MPKLTLIKLGGSIITNKEVPKAVQHDILTRLVKEIGQARSELGNELFIVGHGQGSFAHAPALRYKTMDGFVSKDSLMGMAITQDSAAQLNRIVVSEFINEHMPAVSFLFSNSMVTNERQPQHWCGQVLKEYLIRGLFPVTCGDVLVDQKQGCTIWSTEKILAYLAEILPAEGYQVERVIHVAEVAGVLDRQGNIILEVSRDNQDEVRKHINGTKGFDVTGGMWHKIEESLELADKGVSSYIISGLEESNVYNCLTNKEFRGTTINAS